MKIAVSNASKSWGGWEMMTVTLVRGLRRRGHEVVLFCGGRTPIWERLNDEVPCEPIVRGFDFNPVSLARIHRALRRHRPDVLLAKQNKDLRFTGLAARLLGIPIVRRWELDMPLHDSAPHHRYFYHTLPDHQIAISESVRRTMLGASQRLSPDRVSVIYNGIDVDEFADGPRAELPVPEGALTVGFVGRIEERKGVLDIADAWERIAADVPHAHLVWVGRGELEDEIRSRLRGVPRVHWLGFRDDIASVIRALDVVLVPSHWEGFGLVVAEAMAAAKPVVATDTSNFPELITDGEEGLLVPPRDAGALAGAVVRLLRDEGLRAQMAERGRQRAHREFTLDLMLERHEALLERIVRDRRAGVSTAAGDR